MPDDEEPQQPQSAQIFMPMELKGGVWANYAQVGQSPYEFTFDFVRLDFSQQPPDGIVVARVSMSPLFVMQFLGALQTAWDQYAERAMPQEVTGGAPDEETSEGDEGVGDADTPAG